MSFVTLPVWTKGLIMTVALKSRPLTQVMCIKFKQTHILCSSDGSHAERQ